MADEPSPHSRLVAFVQVCLLLLPPVGSRRTTTRSRTCLVSVCRRARAQRSLATRVPRRRAAHGVSLLFVCPSEVHPSSDIAFHFFATQSVVEPPRLICSRLRSTRATRRSVSCPLSPLELVRRMLTLRSQLFYRAISACQDNGHRIRLHTTLTTPRTTTTSPIRTRRRSTVSSRSISLLRSSPLNTALPPRSSSPARLQRRRVSAGYVRHLRDCECIVLWLSADLALR